MVDAFRQQLRELGHGEGKDIAYEYRWAEGHDSRYPELVADLVRLKVDVIVTTGTPGTLAAKRATNTIPIVFASSGNPVYGGLVVELFAAGWQRHRVHHLGTGTRRQAHSAPQGSGAGNFARCGDLEFGQSRDP